MQFSNRKKLSLVALLLSATLSLPVSAQDTDVIVLDGLDETIAWMKAEGWWGEEARGAQLAVPRALITGIGPNWREVSKTVPVATKKEVFYRFLLPLIMHANVMVLDRREQLQHMAQRLQTGNQLSAEDVASLNEMLVLLRITPIDDAQSKAEVAIEEALYKLDIIPAGLALGQAAYESGYGTSRFAAEGNALFGQWTFGGKGLKPEQQREELGDHRIAAFDWPFDSVRGYFINLMSHPAYDDFRKLRAQLRESGQPLSSEKLAEGLIRYSERGQEYVDTLKGIIRVNNLAIADDAVFRDEPMRFIVGAKDAADAQRLRSEIEAARQSGELDEIIGRMRLD